jgi:hypothetical protein
LAALLMGSPQTLDTTTKPNITSILANMTGKGKTISNILADEETSHQRLGASLTHSMLRTIYLA